MNKLFVFFTVLWIKVQVRTIKYKVSVLTWQFDRLMKKFKSKMDKGV